MLKFLKIIGFCILGLLILIYLGFLFVLPNALDISQYKPLAQEMAKRYGKVDIDFTNPKIITTPLLGAGIKADNFSIKLPDGSLLLSADSLKARIALPSALLLTVKLSCLELENPFINLEIDNDNVDYKVVKLIEDILNESREKTIGEEIETQSWFKPSWIRIKIPCVKLNNYKILLTELSSNHYLDLHGEKLTAGYFNRKRLKIKTIAELYSDKNKNIDANIDINTFLPKPKPKLDKEDDRAERYDVRFINLVDIYRTYDLKAKLDIKERLYNSKHGEKTSYGHFNVDNLSMKVSQLKLPESYIHIKSFGSTLDMDTNIFAAPEQNIQLLGKLNYSKNPKLDMRIKTGEIKFNDMLILSKAFLDSLRINNELSQFKADGTLVSDCYIKTNFKHLKSDGFLHVQNGGLSIRDLGQVISKANIDLLLKDSVLTINNSSLFVDKSKVTIDGGIDKQSVANIMIKTEKLPLGRLFNAFAPKELRNAYKVNSGEMKLDAIINGKMKNAIAEIETVINNLNIGDKKNSFVIKDNYFKGKFTCFTKNADLIGLINNDNFVFTLPKTNSSIRIPKIEATVKEKDFVINDNEIFFNDKSKIKYSGYIKNYEKLDKINFLAEGNINTDDIAKLLGANLKPYLHSQGVIPVKLTFEGDDKKQTLFAQALSDKNNYITPAEFTELGGKQTTLQTVVDFKPKRIKIKKTGLFIRTSSVDEKGNEIVNLNSVFDCDGTIAGRRINLIKVHIPENLSGKFVIFPRSSFLVENSRIFVFGNLSNPHYKGHINIKEIDIPEILTSIENTNLNFFGQNMRFNLKNMMLNGSDINLDGILSLVPSRILNISDLNIVSNDIKVEKLLAVVEKLNKYLPKSSSGSSKHNAQASEIPIAVHSGTIDLKRITTGNIEVTNTTSRITLLKNILGLRNLRTNIFRGNVNGDIDVELNTLIVKTDLKGRNINVEKALLDAANMKGALTGTAEFKAKLNIDGTATTPVAQMKGLKGDVEFNITDGQFGPFGRIENLIIAENIRESQFFQTVLGGIIESLATIDTTHFSEMNGKLNFSDGMCYIDPITSIGSTLTLHIFGDFDLIKNYADLKVRARMSSIISKLLGPLNAINPVNIMSSAASLNVVTAKAFSLFCEVVPSDEMENLPNFSNKYIDSGASKFQLVVRGDAAKPLKMIKSFKWLASKTQFDEAMDYVNSLPEEIEGSTATNIEEAIAEAEALEKEKKTLKYKVKHIFKKD